MHLHVLGGWIRLYGVKRSEESAAFGGALPITAHTGVLCQSSVDTVACKAFQKCQDVV